MIDTRQEMLIALAEAAELEHNLACLYLFAAFTLKTEPTSDGVTQEKAAVFDNWKEKILSVAKQEMGHLGTVCNLLAGIGGACHFRRANFPQPAKYYPPAIDFSLERFGASSLKRFIEFERPEGAVPFALLAAAPDPLAYKRVGDLYRQIRDGFTAIDESSLFINADAPQDEQSWSNTVEVLPVRTRVEAIKAIEYIIEQGEGAPATSGDSHYEIFKTILRELTELQIMQPGLDPARPVASNPRTRLTRDALAGRLISNDTTRETGELFNVIYSVALNMLAQYYSFAGENVAQRQALRLMIGRIMRTAIAPLGEILSRLPMGPKDPGLTAGPGFEIYGEDTPATKPRIAWTIITERLRICSIAATELAPRLPAFAIPRVLQMSSALAGMADALNKNKPN